MHLWCLDSFLRCSCFSPPFFYVFLFHYRCRGVELDFGVDDFELTLVVDTATVWGIAGMLSAFESQYSIAPVGASWLWPLRCVWDEFDSLLWFY